MEMQKDMHSQLAKMMDTVSSKVRQMGRSLDSRKGTAWDTRSATC